MRVAVGLAGAVMPVVSAEGRQLFEPFLDVGDQPVFGVVDVDPGGDVQAEASTRPSWMLALASAFSIWPVMLINSRCFLVLNHKHSVWDFMLRPFI